ncbi:hypothetical protein RHSIM_Rhsim08G0031500 [Rhododendron simsii]|uniref:Uncharacterized protein n=1 Tax=Rhododendron simsii TaxID=118357 RepID=A0A834GK08_RHOSS|nr:hypothetical protein RHSIM_Rhsim08G0031500 [Rhododendron simsii]
MGRQAGPSGYFGNVVRILGAVSKNKEGKDENRKRRPVKPRVAATIFYCRPRAGFEQALRSCSTISSSGLISVKSNRDKAVKNNKAADSKKRKRKGR